MNFIHKYKLEKLVLCHGQLLGKDYENVLKICDVGLNSLAVEREKLTESSALKVREYLAMGLPVYATHKDVSLKNGFIYYKNSPLSIPSIIKYVQVMKKVTREEIRTQSKDLINKEKILLKLVNDLDIYLKK